jgi:hypothetical protein
LFYIGTEIKGKDGVFKIEEHKPVTDSGEISKIFRRNSRGTDVYIIGMSDDPNCGKEMAKSVLNNFWLAVHSNRLDVVIKSDDVNIKFDEANLEELMDVYFADEIERGPISEIYQWNPKAYYKAVKYGGYSDDFLIFNDNLPALGSVRLYVYRKDGLQDRISFMRKPAMTVYKAGRSILSGYAAVFVCDNELGNEILRQMENAAHNEWKHENVRYVRKDEMQVYQNAYKQINDYIKEKLKSISSVANSNKIEVIGLSDFLSIPEELLGDDEGIPGSSDSISRGVSSRNLSEEETGLTTTSDNIIKIKPRATSAYSATTSATSDEGSDIILKGGGERNNDDNPNPNPSVEQGLQTDNGNLNQLGARRAYIPILFRVAANTVEDKLVHNLIITSNGFYPNVVIDIKGGTDNGENIDLRIKEIDQGNVQDNKVTGISLVQGKNIFRVQFEDGIKYSLIITAYEAK